MLPDGGDLADALERAELVALPGRALALLPPETCRLLVRRYRVSARNRDLTEEQAEALADRFVRDMIDDMAAEGKIRFEQ